MHRKLIFLGVVLGLCLVPAAQAAKIIYVSDGYDERPDNVPDDQATVDFLVSLGHTVDYQRVGFGNGTYRTLDATKIADLNAADLIVVGRGLDSGNYATDATEVGQWNAIKTPLILMTPYISRTSRWAWYNNDTLSEDGGTPTLVAVDPHHPIFTGVNLNAKGEVDIYDQSVGSGTVSFVGVLEQGNGTLLAKANSGTRTMIAEWQAGKPFYAGGAQTPAGKRMLLCAGTREGSGFGRGEFNLNDEGKKLFANAVDYMLGLLVREPWVKAWQPSPADGTINVTLPLLQWTKGDTAAFHNVYLGTTPDLTEADQVASRLPQPVHFAANLAPGTKFYWRVDEVEANGTVHTGDVWWFSTPSLLAFDPQPRDGAKWLDPAATTLRWQPGQGAYKHDVYFGTDETAVTEGTGETFKATQLAMVFDPGELAEGTTYWWRVDEVLADGTKRTGAVWSFSTLAPGGGIRGLYFSNASLAGLPLINEIDPQINFNWADASPAGLPADGFSVRWVGELDVPFSETYTFYPTTDDGVRLWVNDVQILNLWTNRRAATEAKASIDLAGGQRYPITMEFYNAEGTAVAELRWESPSIPKDLIPQGAFSPPVRASSPVPGNGAVDVPQTVILMWNPGENATQHDVYFGEDANAVAAADTTSSLYQGRQAADSTSFDPGGLEWNKSYSWRVDEVNDADAASPWKGSVWTFTTADFIVVDDFESYNDDEGTGTRIYETWIDGYTDGLSGSVVGNLDPPFAEQTIVHTGRQSMPLDYNNVDSPFYSEAYREFSPVMDWTINGVTDLSLRVRGAPAPIAAATEVSGKMTVSGEGADIWGAADQFTFVYKTLNGNGSLMARVTDIGTGSSTWAKAGVMIRDSLDAGSASAQVFLTGGDGNGAAFQNRAATDLDMGANDSTSSTTAAAVVAAPYWVKIERTSDTIAAYLSADGKTWTQLGTSQYIAMNAPSYIGICVTSHAAGEYRTFAFDSIQATGAGGSWQTKEVGLTRNSPQPLYVTVEDSSGKKATVVDPNAAAVNALQWTEWKTPLSDFAGVNLTKVKAFYIGVGDKANPTPDGTGRIYIDDIRVVKP
jgi:hypothetical protein